MTSHQRNNQKREARLKERYAALQSRGLGVRFDRFGNRYVPRGTAFIVLPVGGSERHTYANRASGRNGIAHKI